MIEVLIDPDAGFCPGVHRAVQLIETRLNGGEVFAIGAVIHNPRELDRLAGKGLKTLSQDQVESGDHDSLRGRRLLIRTHGVGQELWRRVQQEGAELIDATCGIVRRVQKLVEGYHDRGYQIVIIGKKNHPEMIGLRGHCGDQAIVIESEKDIARIDPNLRTVVVAQTTAGKDSFTRLAERIRERVPDAEVIDTTCKFIERRHQQVIDFARSVDALIFIGGRESSNSKVLYELCHSANPRSHHIEAPEELDLEWFANVGNVGITGGASTPYWQFEQARDRIMQMMRG